VHSVKISLEFECQGQRPKVKVTYRGQKNEKCGILFGSCLLERDPRAAFIGRGFYAGGKISARCLVTFSVCIVGRLLQLRSPQRYGQKKKFISCARVASRGNEIVTI